MKFSYTALSSDNQKLTGVLEAESLDAAQGELHKMGVSIIAINEVSEEEFEKQKETEKKEKATSGIITFTFEAVDPNGKEINGTIDAEDEYSGYKRLRIDYGFKINALYGIDALDAEKDASKGKVDGWEEMLKSEGIEIKTPGQMRGELDSEEEQIDQKIIKEIDDFIINSKKVLSEHQDKFSPAFVKQIEKTLGELERIRTSNNLKHISEVCNQLYELISHPDQIEEEAIQSSEYANILEIMKGSGIIHKQFDIHSKAVGFKKIRTIFDKIMGKLKGEGQKTLGIKKDFNKEKKAGLLDKIFKKKDKATTKPKEENASIALVKKFFSYLAAPNAVLRKTRKKELFDFYNKLRGGKKKIKKSEKAQETKEVKIEKNKKIEEVVKNDTEEVSMQKTEEKHEKLDTSSIFVEIDSFLGWLLFFYISYLFLVNFSLEKDMGIPREFIIKTLKSPLIINITIFLLFAHLIFKIKNEYFRKNLLGTLFLLFFGFGLYTLLVINF